jgi:hypothetical protein
MKDLIGSRWPTEPTDEESCFASPLGWCGGCTLPGASCWWSSCELWVLTEDERLRPHGEVSKAGNDIVDVGQLPTGQSARCGITDPQTK